MSQFASTYIYGEMNILEKLLGADIDVVIYIIVLFFDAVSDLDGYKLFDFA